MYETIFIEERNISAVMLAFDYFANDAESAASSKGMPGLRIIRESIVSECTVTEELAARIDTVMGKILAVLTNSLTEEEKSPVPGNIEESPRIIFKGNIHEINRFFYQRGWTDDSPGIRSKV